MTDVVPAIKTYCDPYTARLLEDGDRRLVEPGEMPVPPADDADPNARANYSNRATNYKMLSSMWNSANEKGLALLREYVDESVMKQYVYGQIKPGNFREAYDKLDAQFGKKNTDAVLTSMDSSAVYKTLHSSIKIVTTFISFWNLVVTYFHAYFNKNKTTAEQNLQLDSDGKGAMAENALDIVIAGIERSPAIWKQRLENWESTHAQTRTMESLVTFMKRHDNSDVDNITGKKRGRTEDDPITSEQTHTKLLKLTSKKLNQLTKAFYKKQKGPQTASVSSASGKTTNTTTTTNTAVLNKHPNFKREEFRSPGEVCWNCGDVTHNTKACKKPECSYCAQNKYPNCKKGWWKCAKRQEDKGNDCYKFLPAATCRC
jgi:hypothetical protein